MSSYTTQLRYICESLSGLDESLGLADADDIIAKARPKIFNFDYPIYDETHREELETKIISHYYTREIGMETYGLWKLRLKNKMNEIMPYYNQLYMTASLEYSPIDDVNYTKTHAGTHKVGVDETGKETGKVKTDKTGKTQDKTNFEHDQTNTSTDWNFYSDTPQGAISRIDVDGNNYLTNAEKDTHNASEHYESERQDDATSEDHTTTDSTRDTADTKKEEGENEWTETMKGKVGTYSYSKLIKDYREQILNIDLMIIEALSDLFMLLWD